MNRRALLVSLAGATALAGCQGGGTLDCALAFADDPADAVLAEVDRRPLGGETRLTMAFRAPTGTDANPTDRLLVFDASGELLGESAVPPGLRRFRWHVEGGDLTDGVVRALDADGRYVETRRLDARCPA